MYKAGNGLQSLTAFLLFLKIVIKTVISVTLQLTVFSGILLVLERLVNIVDHLSFPRRWFLFCLAVGEVDLVVCYPGICS